MRKTYINRRIAGLLASGGIAFLLVAILWVIFINMYHVGIDTVVWGGLLVGMMAFIAIKEILKAIRYIYSDWFERGW